MNRLVWHMTSVWWPPPSSTVKVCTDSSTAGPWAHWCPPIVANLYLEELESRALITFTERSSCHWFRYVNDTWVTIRTREVEAFTEQLWTNNIKLTGGDVRGDGLPLLDCTVHTEEDRSFNIEVYRKPSHRSTLAVWPSSPSGAQAEVIRTLNHQAETMPTKTEGEEKEQEHIRGALKTCGHPNWTCQNL